VVVGLLPMVVGVTALCFRDWRRRLWADAGSWAAAAGVVTILVVPWFAYEYAIFGSRFWEIIFGAHVYDRARGTLAPEHIQPWYYYYTQLFLELSRGGVAVWVMVGAALWVLESTRRRWKGGVLILAWHLVSLGVISMSAAKLYHYSFPFLAPVALMGAYPVSLLARVSRRLYSSSAWTGWARRSAWNWPARFAAAALPVAFLLFAWPVDQHGTMLESLGNGRRPLSALRACLVNEFDNQRATSPDLVSRIYMHMPGGLIHPFYYYYRVFDRWEHLESPSDAVLFVRLFVPNHRAVTLIPADDYMSFLERIGSPELGEELQALAIERQDPTLAAGYTSGELTGTLPAAVQIGGAGASGSLFVLPGRLSRCADVAAREGGVLFTSG